MVGFATRLFGSARAGETATLASYPDSGVPPNLANGLLRSAAYHGYADTVRAQVSGAADPSRENDRGQSPPAGAVFKNEPALLDAGADPHTSALNAARMFGRGVRRLVRGVLVHDPFKSMVGLCPKTRLCHIQAGTLAA